MLRGGDAVQMVQPVGGHQGSVGFASLVLLAEGVRWHVDRRCGRRSRATVRYGNNRTSARREFNDRLRDSSRRTYSRRGRAEDRETQAREKDRVEAERLAALAQAVECNARLEARVAELAGVLDGLFSVLDSDVLDTASL